MKEHEVKPVTEFSHQHFEKYVLFFASQSWLFDTSTKTYTKTEKFIKQSGQCTRLRVG